MADIFTRAQYMNASLEDGPNAHRRYYGEIVRAMPRINFDDATKQRARQALANGDQHLNSIPLQWWDARVSTLRGATAALKERGDYLTLGAGVCILKEAMRQQIEAETPKGIRTGTAHFVSIEAAEDYYSLMGETASDVAEKIAAGDIHIGAPELKEGQRLSVIKGEGRYQIEE